jgi:hypothetical protein
LFDVDDLRVAQQLHELDLRHRDAEAELPEVAHLDVVVGEREVSCWPSSKNRNAVALGIAAGRDERSSSGMPAVATGAIVLVETGCCQRCHATRRHAFPGPREAHARIPLRRRVLR